MATKDKNKQQNVKGKRRIPPITIEGAQLIYKNFAGAGKKFNAKGLRNFNVVLDSEMAKLIEQDGWNVKWDEPKEEGDSPRARLKVNVRFDNFPPLIVLITKKGKTMLDEEMVDLLDRAEIENVDLKISASTGLMQDSGEPYTKAYLSEMYVTLSEHDLASKYMDVSPSKRVLSAIDDD